MSMWLSIAQARATCVQSWDLMCVLSYVCSYVLSYVYSYVTTYVSSPL